MQGRPSHVMSGACPNFHQLRNLATPNHTLPLRRAHQSPRMRSLAAAYAKQKLCLDYAHLKHACPKGVYVAPVPEEPLLWTGVLFVRKGPYANAVLRFEIDFPLHYPAHPPTVTFLSDVFHPLVTPLTTYTYTMRDAGGDTMSAADRDRLPPGGLSLRHGFPEWFNDVRGGSNDKDASLPLVESEKHSAASEPEALGSTRRPPMTVEVLQYMRIVFDTEAMLDSVPLEAAANPGAWHAWKSYRAKALGGRASPVAHLPSSPSDTTSERSTSPRQQPGGARRPAEWNWQGVWEDRVRKCLQASISEPMLFAGDSNDVICFSKMYPDAVQQIKPV